MSPVRDHIDAITRRAAVEADVDPDSDARQELASHLYDLARDRAVGRYVTRADIDAAWAELAPQAIYLLAGEEASTPAPEQQAVRVDPAAVATRRPRGVNWFLRFIAYLVDAALVLGVVVPSMALAIDVVGPPLGDVGETLLILAILLAGPVTLVRLETRRGGTPGKLLFQLRTVDAIGGRPSWRQALLITLPKLFPPLVVLDVLLGLLTGRKDRLRLTERLARVRVVPASQALPSPSAVP